MLGWEYFRFNQSIRKFGKVLEFYNFGREESLYYMTTPCFLVKQKKHSRMFTGFISREWKCRRSSPLSSVQFSRSVVSDSETPQTAARQAFLSIANSRSLLKLMSIESVMLSNHLIFCCPLLLPPSVFPRIRVFSNESVLHIRWPKYWSFSFSISPSNEYSGLISFRMDWLDLLAIQGTLKSLLQHHSSKILPLYSLLFCIL